MTSEQNDTDVSDIDTDTSWYVSSSKYQGTLFSSASC